MNKYSYAQHFCSFFKIFPVVGILAFGPPGLGSYLMRATESYLFEGLVAAALFEPAVNCDRVESIEKTTLMFSTGKDTFIAHY